MTAQDGTSPPESLLRPPSPPARGSGLTPRPGFHPPDWAWPGPFSRAQPSYIPPWARAGSPAKLSSISTRPGLIPRRVHTLCLEKKGAAGIASKVCPPGPPAALHPTAFLPHHSQGINCPSPSGLQQVWRDPRSAFLLLLPGHGPRGAAPSEAKFLLPQAATAWTACPPPRLLRTLQRSRPGTQSSPQPAFPGRALAPGLGDLRRGLTSPSPELALPPAQLGPRGPPCR